MRQSRSDNELVDVGDALGDLGIDRTVVPVHPCLQVTRTILSRTKIVIFLVYQKKKYIICRATFQQFLAGPERWSGDAGQRSNALLVAGLLAGASSHSSCGSTDRRHGQSVSIGRISTFRIHICRTNSMRGLLFAA